MKEGIKATVNIDITAETQVNDLLEELQEVTTHTSWDNIPKRIERANKILDTLQELKSRCSEVTQHNIDEISQTCQKIIECMSTCSGLMEKLASV